MPTTRKTPESTAEVVSVSAQLEQTQRALLAVVCNAVSPETDHGVDIVLAKQASEVYKNLFGDNR